MEKPSPSTEDYLPMPELLEPEYLISGSSGFIGQRLAQALTRANVPWHGLDRRAISPRSRLIADLNDKQRMTAACQGIHTVVHCAGYAHAFAASNEAEANKHWETNFTGTLTLAEIAAQAGVKRFIFLSSVKAMAEPGALRADESLPGEPNTAYGLAKRAAEQALFTTAERYGMTAIVLRLSMVYGKGGRGNLERMAKLVQRGLFPPLPETGNQRSLVHVDDVVSAIRHVATEPRADGQTYIVCGPDSPSGRQLFDAIRAQHQLPKCNWEIPLGALQSAARLGDGLSHLLQRPLPLTSEILGRLLESACYSNEKIARELAWHPQVGLKQGLEEMFGRETLF
jgi:nucleoside-diphosphate-sugar epimerase